MTHDTTPAVLLRRWAAAQLTVAWRLLRCVLHEAVPPPPFINQAAWREAKGAGLLDPFADAGWVKFGKGTYVRWLGIFGRRERASDHMWMASCTRL